MAADPARRALPAASTATPGANGPGRAEGIAEVERRAAAYGLPPIVWPEPWPGNGLFAMRAATFAKQTGRTVSFALAGFRQAFAAGRDLSDPDNVLIAAAACELHPNALTKAVETKAVKGAAARGDRARPPSWACSGVPSLVVGGEVFWGDDRLEEAVAGGELRSGAWPTSPMPPPVTSCSRG